MLYLTINLLRTIKLKFDILCSCASNLKKTSLELGGKSPLIIFKDCDMEKAVRFVSLVINKKTLY